MRNVRMYRRATIVSDHFLVVAKTKNQMNKRNYGRKYTKWDIEVLKQSKTSNKHVQCVENLIASEVVPETENIKKGGSICSKF